MYLHNIKLWTFLTALTMPVTVLAGKIAPKFGVAELVSDSVVIALIALFSLMGGIGAVFIKTDADEFVRHPELAKVFIGFWFGLGLGLGVYYYYAIPIYVLLAPVFMVSALGSAILVFYMQWFSDPKTRRELRDKLNGTIGIDRNKGA